LLDKENHARLRFYLSGLSSEIYDPSSFFRVWKKSVECKYCHSANVQRKIGKVRISRSSDNLVDDLEDGENLDRLEEDPRAMAKMLRKMKSEMGEEADQPEFNEVVSRLESGQTPDEIEQDMPDLGESAGGMEDETSLPDDDY